MSRTITRSVAAREHLSARAIRARPPKRRHAPPDGLRKIDPRRPFVGQRFTENLPQLRFHPLPVPRRPHAQLIPQPQIDMANGQPGGCGLARGFMKTFYAMPVLPASAQPPASRHFLLIPIRAHYRVRADLAAALFDAGARSAHQSSWDFSQITALQHDLCCNCEGGVASSVPQRALRCSLDVSSLDLGGFSEPPFFCP